MHPARPPRAAGGARAHREITGAALRWCAPSPVALPRDCSAARIISLILASCAPEGLMGSKWIASFLLEHICHLMGALGNFIPRNESCGISGPLVGGRHAMCLGSRFSRRSSPHTEQSCALGGLSFPFPSQAIHFSSLGREGKRSLSSLPLPCLRKHLPCLGGRF